VWGGIIGNGIYLIIMSSFQLVFSYYRKIY
jgi:hypothetical protein